MNAEQPIIKFKDIKFSYPGGKTVLNNLDFEFYKGDRVGLIAPNGSGKTTFLNLIMGLNSPVSGDIELFGQTVASPKDFEEARQRIGLLFQDADDQLFSPTVIDDVAFGPLNLGNSREDALGIARRTLANLGLEDFENRITFKLSGGEKRLVSLATVLAMEPDVLLLDEPLNGLDYDTGLKIEETISGLDLSYLIISHDIDFLLSTTDRICTIKQGRIIFDDEEHIHEHRHIHPHGRSPHKHQ